MANYFTRYKVEDRSFVAFIKREIHQGAVLAKFTSVETGKIDIIVSELTSNLIKHAGGGEILYRFSVHNGDPEIEILSIDKGPGMSDIAQMMKDGTSTTNTLGQGLGAMERLSSTFQVYSLAQWGTLLYARFGPKVQPQDKSGFGVDAKALCIPKPLEEECGDGYRVIQSASHVKIFFGDGLGHGKHAMEAVETAGDHFREDYDYEPVGIIRRMHEKVRRTRGLVGTIAVLDRKANQWSICGVGNILTRMYTGIEYRNYMPYNGTIGLNLPNSMKSTLVPAERNQHLIMCSDGLQTRWDLHRYPSVFKYDQLILAGALYKDFSRGTDDASVLIAKVI